MSALILFLTLFAGCCFGLIINIYQIIHLLLVTISSVLWLQWTFSVVPKILEARDSHIYNEELLKLIPASVLTAGYIILVTVRWDHIDDFYIPLIFFE